MQKTRIIAGSTLVLLAVGATPALADSGKTTQTQQCDLPGHSISLTGSKTLWPPNHKFRDYTIGAVGTALETVMISSTVTNDEVIDGKELNGAGHTLVDAQPNPAEGEGQGSATALQQIRGEHSGRGDGRTYTFTVTATYNLAYSCVKSFTVTVPHDQRPSTKPAKRKVAKRKQARRA